MRTQIKTLTLAAAAAGALLGSPAQAAVVQLPVTVIYSASRAPRRLQAKVGDSNIRIVAGKNFRITSQPKANGITASHLEEAARKAVTTYDPSTGILTASTPRMSIGNVSAEVTVEVPGPVGLEILAKDGNISLERLTVEDLAVQTADGNVDLFEVSNQGQGRIQTSDGNVKVQGSKIGRVSPNIKGDGRFIDERDDKDGSGGLTVTTQDGNVTIRK